MSIAQYTILLPMALPISIFLITNFQFGYFSFPILSFLIILTSNLDINFLIPISNFLIL